MSLIYHTIWVFSIVSLLTQDLSAATNSDEVNTETPGNAAPDLETSDPIETRRGSIDDAEDEIHDKADCSEPMVIGRCRARIRRFYFDTELGKCSQFYYGGCGANHNNFKSIQQCYRICGGSDPDVTSGHPKGPGKLGPKLKRAKVPS